MFVSGLPCQGKQCLRGEGRLPIATRACLCHREQTVCSQGRHSPTQLDSVQLSSARDPGSLTRGPLVRDCAHSHRELLKNPAPHATNRLSGSCATSDNTPAGGPNREKPVRRAGRRCPTAHLCHVTCSSYSPASDTSAAPRHTHGRCPHTL